MRNSGVTTSRAFRSAGLARVHPAWEHAPALRAAAPKHATHALTLASSQIRARTQGRGVQQLLAHQPAPPSASGCTSAAAGLPLQLSSLLVRLALAALLPPVPSSSMRRVGARALHTAAKLLLLLRAAMALLPLPPLPPLLPPLLLLVVVVAAVVVVVAGGATRVVERAGGSALMSRPESSTAAAPTIVEATAGGGAGGHGCSVDRCKRDELSSSQRGVSGSSGVWREAGLSLELPLGCLVCPWLPAGAGFKAIAYCQVSSAEVVHSLPTGRECTQQPWPHCTINDNLLN